MHARPTPRQTATRLLRDRRGAAAAMVASAAAVFIGVVGLAVEGGGWYLALRRATTAADLAAVAGANARLRGGDPRAVATDVAQRNGFATGGGITVTVNVPPASGAFAGVAGAVEVTVAQAQRAVISSALFGPAPLVRSRAVAAAQLDDKVCLLALGGGLTLGGNSTTQASRCVLASNQAAPGGLDVVGSARVRTAGLVTTGNCNGCGSGDVWTDDTRTARPYVVARRSDPVADPFAGLQGWTPAPPPCRASPVAFTGRTASLAPGAAICESLTVGTNETLNLAPGIHYLVNADLTVRGRITGDGVTIVLTGDPGRVGTIQINAQATGLLRGPATSLVPGHPEGAGLVAYRDARATNNGPQKEVQLNGGATMDIIGGVYFPTSDVVVNGNSAMGSNCFAVVGWALSLSGNSDTQVDVSGCPGFAPHPVVQTVRLVE
ncbi:pilus assembly protein TadG-related protein [Falsiroseomonas sp. CW058]|uniref:pilus assembly protein TadG-related protein n=1 Tax=Falsiroseomonas sp. CW058 TaxID=3388664 RepID=UPI003D32331D